MSPSISTGQYIITSSVPDVPKIGVDNCDNCAVKPVIVDGEEFVWNVTEVEPGKYHISIGYYHSREDQDRNVVVDTLPPGQIWQINFIEEDLYTIERDTPIRPNQGWALTSTKPKSPVALHFIEVPFPEQLWKFIPVHSD